jgi:hypothetical protein
MAVEASSGLRLRLVVMEETAEQPENEERNNDKTLNWELPPNAPF